MKIAITLISSLFIYSFGICQSYTSLYVKKNDGTIINHDNLVYKLNKKSVLLRHAFISSNTKYQTTELSSVFYNVTPSKNDASEVEQLVFITNKWKKSDTKTGGFTTHDVQFKKDKDVRGLFNAVVYFSTGDTSIVRIKVSDAGVSFGPIKITDINSFRFYLLIGNKMTLLGPYGKKRQQDYYKLLSTTFNNEELNPIFLKISRMKFSQLKENFLEFGKLKSLYLEKYFQVL